MPANHREPLGYDDPVPLVLAAEIFFPAGGVTPSSLRTEIRNGHLVVERIAGKDFVTRRAIEQMRERCRSQPKSRDSGSTEGQKKARSGSSSIAESTSQRDATKATAKALKKPSPTTSPANTSGHLAHVVPIK
jgi:hypothetical protein